MGLDLTADHPWIQGLVIQDDRFVAANIDADLSTASQAGPLPGYCIAQQDSDLVFDTVGSQSAGQQLRLQAQRSGHPGTDEASMLWWYEGDDLKHGWDAPLTISDFEFIDYTSTTNAWRYPDAISTPEGKIVVVAQEGSSKVSSWTRDPATATWSKTEIHDKGTAYGDGAHPCILHLPSGRILSFFWRPVGNQATVRMEYTDDDGATWKLGQLECLPDPISTTTTTLGRLRARFLGGEICLLASLYDSSAGTKHQIAQYASDDLGSTFALISTLDTDNSRVKPDMVVAKGKLVVAYVSYDPSADVVPYVRVLGSAHEPLTSADASSARSGSMEWGQQASGTFSASELALFVDQDESLYLLGIDHNAAGTPTAKKELACLRSSDGGSTWEAPSDSSAAADGATLWNARDAAFHFEDFCAVAWRGCGVVIHGGVADAEAVLDVGESLMATFFGGYTTVCMPEYAALGAHEIVNRASFEHTWLPWFAPEDLPAYTLTRVGAPLPTLIASSLGRGVTHTDVSQQAYWTAQTTDDLTSGSILLVEVNHEVNTALASEVIVVISDGAGSPTSYALSVRVTGTTIALYDSPAGAGGGTIIGTATSATDGMTGVQILISVQEVDGAGHGAAWMRPRGAGAHDWQPVGSIGSSTTLTAGTLPTSIVQFGTMIGQASGSALYKLACWTDSTYVGKQLASGQTTLDLLGRTIMATTVYIDDGLSVFASDGPTYRPDAWDIDTRYIHAWANTDPRKVATPRLGHRTLNDASDADIVWKLGETTSDEHGLMGTMLAIYLGEINWRTAEVWVRSGGTWFKVADIDAATGMNGLGWRRRGQLIQPDVTTGSSADRYFLEHLLAGSTFDFGTGTPRKIKTNSSGAWTLASVGTAKTPRLMLEDYDPADPATGNQGAIWSKEVLALLPVGANSDYDAVRLRIKAQTTADGDLRTGIAMVGWLMAYGQPTSIGRAVGSEARNELTEGRNGVRTVRKLSGNRASLEFDWTDGVFDEGLSESPPHPPYIQTYPGSGAILATPADVPWSMQGAYDRACGAVDPVVAAVRIPLGSDATPIILTDRSRFLYGRLVSESFRLDAADGNEWDPDRPEYIRVNTTRIEEEL